MARLRALQHHPAEAPGAIAGWASAAGHTLDIVHTPSAALPTQDDGIDGLIVLGGPWCAFADDRPEWLRREQAWLHTRLREGMPAFAICLGAQLVAQTLGAALHRMPAAETGWVAIDSLEHAPLQRDSRANAPGDDAALIDRSVHADQSVHVLQWHEDRFDLPPDCSPIAINSDTDARRQCPVQGYAGTGGRIVGLQFHAEWTARIVHDLHLAFGDACPLPPADAHPQRYAPMHAWLHRRLDRWLHDCGRE